MGSSINIPPGASSESGWFEVLCAVTLYAQLIVGLAAAVGIGYAYHLWVLVYYGR